MDTLRDDSSEHCALPQRTVSVPSWRADCDGLLTRTGTFTESSDADFDQSAGGSQARSFSSSTSTVEPASYFCQNSWVVAAIVRHAGRRTVREVRWGAELTLSDNRRIESSATRSRVHQSFE